MRGASRNPLVASYVVPFAVIRSMYTGGISLLLGRCCGSIALAPPKESYEPYFPVGGPGHLGALDKPDGCIGHSVGAVENCRPDLPVRIGGPCIKFVAR